MTLTRPGFVPAFLSVGVVVMVTAMRCMLIALVLVLLCTVPTVRADWINLTGAETAPNIAEISVLDDHVKVVLEMYIGDFATFADLLPDAWLKSTHATRMAPTDRLRRFSAETLQVITETGERIQAQLHVIEPRLRKDRQSPFAGMSNPITRQRVPDPPADKRVAYAELIYPFTAKPKTLTIIPPLDQEGRALVTIGFIAYHKAVPIIDFRYLGAPAQLTLNWADPWYTTFANPNLKRHHKSALMSFLYVEPYEVRHEILTRVKDLEQWMELGLRGDRYIERDELEPLQQRIGAFFLHKNPLRVDGTLVKPILDRTNYVKVSLRGIQLVEQPERLEISTAIVGVILAYMTAGLPQQVTVEWELFTDQIPKVPATAIDPAGPLMSYVTPDDPVVTWTNFLKNYTIPDVQDVTVSETLTTFSLPLGSVVCLAVLIPVAWQIRTHRRRTGVMGFYAGLAVLVMVGGLLLYPHLRVSIGRPAIMRPAVSEDAARLLLRQLLKNVYRAFDFRQEEDIYDKLAVSVSGDLLADIYLQNRQSFAIQQAGGAQAKVKAVELLDVAVHPRPTQPLAMAFRTTWTALGTVGHWGHVHMRQNQYEAIITVAPVGGAWKITELELVEEKRIDPNAPAATKAGS